MDAQRPADFVTVAYDADTGAELWTAVYDSSGDDIAIAIAVSPDGRKVFVTGFAGDPVGPATVAYGAVTGDRLWVAVGDEEGAAYAVTVSPDGRFVYATGCSAGDCNDYLTLAYDATTGTEEWEGKYDGPAHGQDFAVDIGVTPDGNRVFVTGANVGRYGYAYATVSYDAHTGTPLWVSRYQGPGHAGGDATALGVSPDGEACVLSG